MPVASAGVVGHGCPTVVSEIGAPAPLAPVAGSPEAPYEPVFAVSSTGSADGSTGKLPELPLPRNAGRSSPVLKPRLSNVEN